MKARITDEWQRCRSVMVQMPTGTGKTRLLASVVNDELNTDDETNGRTRSVWIVAHRRELVEQIKETVEQFIINNEQFIIHNAQSYYDGRIKVMSIQWLARHWEDVRDERPGLIVIDEAHHALADSYTELWRRYPEAKKLGMTATPCRMNGKGFTDLFDVLVMSDSIAEFIRLGWLSAFDYVSIKDGSDEQKLVDSLNKRGADGDYQVKEMNAVLNKRPSIARLYESMRRYADGKKGIVYAISIEHARNIAEYYTQHGTTAAAIDSRTPARERKRLVDEFKAGRLKVMVNVDVFSEGFDCPDVEFVQMGRPTLSLAKYLQQAGRGMRKSKGKAACTMIDNVGLYRMFGLPVARHDWQAMFEGRLAGKGCARKEQAEFGWTVKDERLDMAHGTDGDMEMVMNHDRLMEYLTEGCEESGSTHDEGRLRAYRDRKSGLYGLKRGEVITAKAQYEKVMDTDGDMAAVRFSDGRVGVVSAEGELKMKIDRYGRMRFMKDRLMAVTDRNKRVFYIDMRSGRLYKKKPEVRRYGNVEILTVDGMCYSRTKKLYEGRMNDDCMKMCRNTGCLRICDYLSEPKCRQVGRKDDSWAYDSVCLLPDDFETYYHFCGQLADMSIIIADPEGKYYIVEEGKEKRYIAREDARTKDEDFDTVTERLKAEAQRRADERRTNENRLKEKTRKDRLERMKRAVPFKSGLKWGLKLDGKIIVPPIYRSIQGPVGNYCAVETSPRQWGVIMLDGKVVIEARYISVEISDDGTACLTVFPGKTKTVKLNGN